MARIHAQPNQYQGEAQPIPPVVVPATLAQSASAGVRPLPIIPLPVIRLIIWVHGAIMLSIYSYSFQRVVLGFGRSRRGNVSQGLFPLPAPVFFRPETLEIFDYGPYLPVT